MKNCSQLKMLWRRQNTLDQGLQRGIMFADKNPSEPKSTETPSIEVSIPCPAEGCLERFPRWSALLEHWRMTHEALMLTFRWPFHRCPYQHVKGGQVARHLCKIHQRQSRYIIIQGRLDKNHKFKKPCMSKDVASFLRI